MSKLGDAVDKALATAEKVTQRLADRAAQRRAQYDTDVAEWERNGAVGRGPKYPA